MPSERIQLLIDVVTGQSKSALSRLKTDLAAADTATGKLKVTGGAVGDYFKQNFALAMAGAGTAVAGFVAKSVGDFQNLALEVGKFRDATGLAAEEASRFKEVGDDLGIPVQTLQTAIGRLNRAAAETPEAFDNIGAAIARNSDGTVNVQQTFLNTIDALNQIPDAAQRASRAQEIFGRGWQQIAELVGMGADDVKAALEGVESAKVIDDGEIRKAREFRDNLDELKGAFEALTLSIGEGVVPVLSDVIGLFGHLKAGIDALPEPPGWLTTAAKWMTPIGPIEAINTGLNNLRGNFERVANVTPLAEQAIEDEAETAEAAATKMAELADSAAKVATAAEEQKAALDDLLATYLAAIDDTFAFEKANLALADAVANMREKKRDATATTREQREAEIAAAEAALGAAQAYADQSGAAEGSTAHIAAMKDELQRQADKYPGLRDEIGQYISKLDGIPPEVTTNVDLKTADAMAAANAFEERLNNIQDEEVIVHARTVYSNDRPGGGGIGVGAPGVGGTDAFGLSAGRRRPTIQQLRNRAGRLAGRASSFLEAVLAGRRAGDARRTAGDEFEQANRAFTTEGVSAERRAQEIRDAEDAALSAADAAAEAARERAERSGRAFSEADAARVRQRTLQQFAARGGPAGEAIQRLIGEIDFPNMIRSFEEAARLAKIADEREKRQEQRERQRERREERREAREEQTNELLTGILHALGGTVRGLRGGRR